MIYLMVNPLRKLDKPGTQTVEPSLIDLSSGCSLALVGTQASPEAPSTRRRRPRWLNAEEKSCRVQG